MRTPHSILLLGAALLWAASHVHAATPQDKLVLQQARDAAAASYKNARARCNTVTGNPRDLCIAEAEAGRVRAEEEARARYEDTLDAYTRARMRIADAGYERDKTRCAALTGNDKDVCRKTIEARNEARQDKLAAAYKVAMEKCDAFAGAAKDQCVSAAKAEFGK
jgi:hypothetical protein